MSRLTEHLVSAGLMERTRLDALLEDNPECISDKGLYNYLLENDIIPEQALMRAAATVYSLEFIPQIEERFLDSRLIENIPIAWTRQHCVLPVSREGSVVLLAAKPDVAEEEEYLSLLLGQELVTALCPESEIRRCIEQCYVSREGGREKILEGLGEDEGRTEAQVGTGEMDLLSSIEGAPVTQLVNLILLEAVKSDASDIHLEPYEDRFQLRYRIDGVLYKQQSPPKHLQNALISRLKVMAHLDIAEKRLPQDGMAKVRVGDREIDLRVSSIPVAEGERLVLRLLSRSSVLKPMDALGMTNELLEVFKELLSQPQGIILVTGPTGSGKTTTLYAALQEMDAEHSNIITIEDPIEYQLERISQIQVKPRIGLTFASGLRHILRQDPDTILVGEIRDIETAEIAIRSSLTGHLVLSTLHTNDAASSPLRIVDMGIQPYLLSESLRAVLAQRLVRRLCPACRNEGETKEEDLKKLASLAGAKPGLSHHFVPNGCEKCRDGYKGRVGLFEYLIANREVKEAIREEAPWQHLRELSARYGMDTLWEDGFRKIEEGATSIEEVRRVLGNRL